MGYYMYQNKCDFKIKRENIPKAFNALRTLFSSDSPPTGWIYPKDVLAANTFEDAIGEARWDVYFEADHLDIVGIYFNGEKYSGEEEIVLGAIAPYVEDGSYIEMNGEDGALWRWAFEDGECIEKTPLIIWD